MQKIVPFHSSPPSPPAEMEERHWEAEGKVRAPAHQHDPGNDDKNNNDDYR